MRLFLLVVLLALLIPAKAFAISKGHRYTLRHYTTDDGLTQNSVNAIVHGQDGYVWMATIRGLSRFDGISFKTFNTRNRGTRGDDFMFFASDSEGRKDRFYAVTGTDCFKVANGTVARDQNSLKVRDRSIWESEKIGAGLSYSVDLPVRPRNEIEVANYVFLHPGKRGSFFLWRKGGKVELYESWKKRKTTDTGLSSPSGIFMLGQNLYYDDEHGNFSLIASADEALQKTGKIRLTSTLKEDRSLQLTKPYVVYSHHLSGQAFICQDQTLYQLSQDAGGEIRSSVLLEGFDFQRSNIVSIFFDAKRRRLFMGSSTSGLFIAEFHMFETLTVDGDELEINNYYSHVAFSDSTILTPSFYVLGKTATGVTVTYRIPRIIREVPAHRLNVLRGRDGDIWYRKGSRLYRSDGHSNLPKGSWDAGGTIGPIFEDSAGRVWLGTRESGLQYVDPREKGTPLHIFSCDIRDVANFLEEGPDTLWIGGYSGIYRISRNQKVYSRVPNTENFWISSMSVPKQGELWFTTVGNGFYFVQKNSLLRMPLDKNRFLSTALCMISDNNGFFWMPTARGLFRIYRQDLLDFTLHKDSTRLHYHHYSKLNGLRTDEFNGGSQPWAVRLKNGYLSLPSIDGLVFFKPEQTPADVPDSKIFIDRVEADTREVPVVNSEVELVNVDNIRILVSSPYMGLRENQRLYYALRNENRRESKEIWHILENDQQEIYLSNLESGTYTLKIRKSGGFGRNAERSTTLGIIIPHAWHETWLFKTSVAIAGILSIFLYYKNRLKKISLLNQLLESRVSERTRDLQETLSVLKTSEQELLKQTRLQMHLIASISHDIRSPLRSIEFTSGKLSGLIDNGEHTMAKTVGQSVNESSRRILVLLENMLSYIKSQFSDSSMMYDTFSARELVDEVALIFKQAFVVQQNRFENHVPIAIHLRTNRQLLKIVLHNLIDNANKFTSEGMVTVSGDLSENGLVLRVSDTGIGIRGNILNWFNEGNPAIEESEGDIGGIGLLIVKELAEILKVRIEAHSSSGAQFDIVFAEQD